MALMRALVIETATERGAIGLVDCDTDRRTLIAEELLPEGFQNSKLLLPRLERLFASNGIAPKEIDLVISGIGPGSYTGMRVGAMVAKTFSYSLGKPLVGVSSLDAYLPMGEGSFAVLIDAKIGGVYVTVGSTRKGHVETGQPSAIPLDECAERLAEIEQLLSPHVALLKKRFEKDGIELKGDWQDSSPNILRLAAEGYKKYREGQYSLDGSLKLLYLRKTQAEIEKDSG